MDAERVGEVWTNASLANCEAQTCIKKTFH